LAVDFSEHDYGVPFVPPFLPRVLELQFEKPPEGKSCPMMPWKFGQKVDYWHPTDEVLEAWKTASGMDRQDSGLQISFTKGSFFLSRCIQNIRTNCAFPLAHPRRYTWFANGGTQPQPKYSLKTAFSILSSSMLPLCASHRLVCRFVLASAISSHAKRQWLYPQTGIHDANAKTLDRPSKPVAHGNTRFGLPF
jgi:hypothetical protein